MVAAGLWMASGETADLGAGMASDRFDVLLRYGAMASAPIPVDPMEVAFHEAAVSAACQYVRGWTLIHTNTLRPDLLAMPNIWASPGQERSEENTSELQSLMRISYAVFCFKQPYISPLHKSRLNLTNEPTHPRHL